MTVMSALGTLLAISLVIAPPPPRGAYHELQDNRVTLVLRDRAHLSVTMYINYTGALHRALAPRLSPQAFIVAYSAMAPEKFRSEVRRAEASFLAGTRVVGAGGREVVLEHWKWPAAAQVQATLQQQAMQAVVAPGDHPAEQPLEIRADGTSSQAISTVTVRFPAEFQRVLVVSYAPNQAWVEPAAPSPLIRF